MCLLCDDEKAYQAYMAYLNAMEKPGAASNPDGAMDAALDAVMASARTEDTTLSTHFPSQGATPPKKPFSCDPVDE